MGPRQVAQGALFYEFSIEDHVPPDHLLRGCCHVNLPSLQVGMPIVDQAAFAADFHASNASSR
ncbi:MAG: hypothetical protein DCO97_19635 [Marivita sp. XM-24bin2]|nr:MAG: hypothetical protein DCO97_19635 [Marivita sp. XM-24bin2]